MAEWSELMRAAIRDLRIGGKIVFGSGIQCTLDGSMILSLTIDEGADGPLEPGSVLSAGCSVDLVNDAGQWNPGGSCIGQNELIGATLMPCLGVLNGEEVLWQDLGVYQVSGALEMQNGSMLRLQAQDSISMELGEAFSDTGSYPCTLVQLWQRALRQTRYTWSGSMANGGGSIAQAPDWKNASLRQALGCIAAAAGSFVRLNRQGGLSLCRLWQDDSALHTVGPEALLKLERDELHYGPVDSLRVVPVGDTQEMVFYTTGQTALWSASIADNPLYISGATGLSTLCRGTLKALAGFEGSSLRFDWRGDPLLCIGDRVEITDSQGRVHSGVLSRQRLIFDGGFRAECSCEIPRENNSGVRRILTPEGGLNAAALSGALNGGLLSVGSVATDKLAAGSITAEKIAAGALDAIVVEAAAAKIGSLTAGDIETDTLAAALAAFTVITAGSAEFDRATVGHLVSNALNLEFGAMDRVFIKNLAVQYAQMVGAAIGNLCIRASDGNYYAIDVDGESGRVTASAVSVSADEALAGQTGAGKMILETNITSESLNTGNLLATYALVNRIDAARIDVDELFARKAFVDLLCTSRIVGEKSLQIIVQDVEDKLSQEEFQRVVRIDEEGMHVGDNRSGSEVLIDSSSVNVVLGGRRYSQFGANYVQFGNYQLRRTADGGLAFKLKEG